MSHSLRSLHAVGGQGGASVVTGSVRSQGEGIHVGLEDPRPRGDRINVIRISADLYGQGSRGRRLGGGLVRLFLLVFAKRDMHLIISGTRKITSREHTNFSWPRGIQTMRRTCKVKSLIRYKNIPLVVYF